MDMTLAGNPLLRSLLGAKRTSLVAAHMSANDPKRTFGSISNPTRRQALVGRVWWFALSDAIIPNIILKSESRDVNLYCHLGRA